MSITQTRMLRRRTKMVKLNPTAGGKGATVHITADTLRVCGLKPGDEVHIIPSNESQEFRVIKTRVKS